MGRRCGRANRRRPVFREVETGGLRIARNDSSPAGEAEFFPPHRKTPENKNRSGNGVRSNQPKAFLFDWPLGLRRINGRGPKFESVEHSNQNGFVLDAGRPANFVGNCNPTG